MAHMEKRREAYLKERVQLEDLGLNRVILLKRVFKNMMEGCGLGCSLAGWGQFSGPCQNGNKHSASIKCGKFLE